MSLKQKVDWELRFWLKKSTFRAKQSTFFFGVVRYFFYRHPERIPKELRGIYSFSFLTVPCRHFFSKFSPFFLHVSILLPNYTIATIYMWSIPHLVDLQIENIRRFAFHVFLPLVVDHMYVVADEDVRSAFFRTLSSTAPDGIIHWALAFCSRLLLMWSSMMRLRRILPVVGQNAVNEM